MHNKKPGEDVSIELPVNATCMCYLLGCFGPCILVYYVDFFVSSAFRVNSQPSTGIMRENQRLTSSPLVYQQPQKKKKQIAKRLLIPGLVLHL